MRSKISKLVSSEMILFSISDAYLYSWNGILDQNSPASLSHASIYYDILCNMTFSGLKKKKDGKTEIPNLTSSYLLHDFSFHFHNVKQSLTTLAVTVGISCKKMLLNQSFQDEFGKSQMKHFTFVFRSCFFPLHYFMIHFVFLPQEVCSKQGEAKKKK